MAKNKVFHILSLALTLGIVISIMISCAKGDPSNGTTADSGTSTSEINSDETKNTPNWEYKPGNRPNKPDDTTVPTPENPPEEPADDTAKDIF